VSLLTYTTKVSQAELKKYVDSCHPVVANVCLVIFLSHPKIFLLRKVRGGSHWVLITGSTGNLNVWEVNDPGTRPFPPLSLSNED